MAANLEKKDSKKHFDSQLFFERTKEQSNQKNRRFHLLKTAYLSAAANLLLLSLLPRPRSSVSTEKSFSPIPFSAAAFSELLLDEDAEEEEGFRRLFPSDEAPSSLGQHVSRERQKNKIRRNQTLI